MPFMVKSFSSVSFCSFHFEVCICLQCLVRKVTVPYFRVGLRGTVLLWCRLWHTSAWFTSAWTSLSPCSTMYLQWPRRFRMKSVSKLFWCCAHDHFPSIVENQGCEFIFIRNHQCSNMWEEKADSLLQWISWGTKLALTLAMASGLNYLYCKSGGLYFDLSYVCIIMRHLWSDHTYSNFVSLVNTTLWCFGALQCNKDKPSCLNSLLL